MCIRNETPRTREATFVQFPHIYHTFPTPAPSLPSIELNTNSRNRACPDCTHKIPKFYSTGVSNSRFTRNEMFSKHIISCYTSYDCQKKKLRMIFGSFYSTGVCNSKDNAKFQDSVMLKASRVLKPYGISQEIKLSTHFLICANIYSNLAETEIVYQVKFYLFQKLLRKS